MSKGKEGRAAHNEAGARVLSLLDAFTVEQPRWTVEMLMKRLHLPQATVYRYVRVLMNAGFLTASWRGGYTLGSRFIEFDRQIRLADPLLQVGPAIMAEHRQEVNGIQFLCTYYGSKILTVHQDGLDDHFAISLERGRVWPLFKGSPAHVILANLPAARLKNIFLHHADSIAASGLGNNWVEFTEKMKKVRRAGFAIGIEKINVSTSGISAPIFGPEAGVIGAICLVRPKNQLSSDEVETLSRLAIRSAKQITEALAAMAEKPESGTVATRGRRRAAVSPKVSK